MHTKKKDLPNDIEKLKRMVLEISSENLVLRSEVAFLRHKLFGRKSEKLTAEEERQLHLFNEAEQEAQEEQDASGEEEAEDGKIHVPAHERRRNKRGRKPLPASLPRVERVHDVPEADKHCGCGVRKKRIGEDVSERLDVEPAKVRVIRNIRPKYACPACEGVEDEGPSVTIAPPPPEMIPKGLATAGLLALVLTAKFEDALPFYRQEKQFRRLGVDVPRATLCGWAIRVARRCEPLLEGIRREIRAGPLIQADETRVQVLREEGRAAEAQSYMWVFRGGGPGRVALEYTYHPSREGAVARQYLKGYEGLVQTDGYKAYDFLEGQPGVRHAGCWAHVRRKFVDLKRAVGAKAKKPGSADKALGYIRRLYRLERQAAKEGLRGAELVRWRQERAGPILKEFRRWMEQRSTQVAPSSPLGKAIGYALNQWKRLTLYVGEAVLTPDNNMVENAIRPFVVGRKNWLFSATVEGAWASATIYSLIETAKANGREPYWYLRYVFERLPLAKSAEDHEALLPWNVPAEVLDSLA